VAQWLLIAGGAIFVVLGVAHALLMLADERWPRMLVPEKTELIAAMAATGLRLARGRTSMWNAWVGFNLSHSVGLMVFGALSIALAGFALPKAVLLVLALVAALYLLLAIRYWFRVPVIGIAAATLCFLGAWLAH
jgi:hypothetical protein